MVLRLFAKEVFGRARLEIDCVEGGLMPEPTLAEKDEFEVVLEALELLRYDWEKEYWEGGREDAAELTAVLTGVVDRGAAKV